MTEGARLVLEDGTAVAGRPFGALRAAAGEVVFNTGMVGYPESLTDPSYRGQILVFTYPLIGNYGVPAGDLSRLESDRIQVAGVVVARLARFHRHAGADRSLAEWLEQSGVPGLEGVDTRALTRHLREAGTMLGKLLPQGGDVPWDDPNARNLLPEVSVPRPVERGTGSRTVVLVDLGCKRSIETSLVARGLRVRRVPWDHPFDEEKADGFVLSNGPGDPRRAGPAIDRTRKLLAGRRPVLGICLGHQVMALASGASVYKLRFGHRGQNQPCVEDGGKRAFITSQNHGFAVDGATLGEDWTSWFRNGNDGSCEGMVHESGRHLAVQFHPEARPGPTDTAFVFDRFLGLLDAS
jgi:carbamoyl-phosphate synthase small subunit